MDAMKRKVAEDARDLELGALLKAAYSARPMEGPRRVVLRSGWRRRGLVLPFAAAALLLAGAGLALGPPALARKVALKNSLAFAQDILDESPAAFYLDVPPPRGRDAEALSGFIDDLWAEP